MVCELMEEKNQSIFIDPKVEVPSKALFVILHI